MADVRDSRRAARAARTRARTIEMRGPVVRLTHVEKESTRASRGRKTLAEAFRGVPSRAEFLSRADAFEMAPGKTRVLRAFATPSGEPLSRRADGTKTVLFWYRGNASIDPPRRGVPVVVETRDGRTLEVVPVEDATPGGSTAKLEGKKHERTCTGTTVATISRRRGAPPPSNPP